MERDPLDIINEFLGLELAHTVRGDELKGDDASHQHDGRRCA